MIHKVSESLPTCQYPLNHTDFTGLSTIENVKEWKAWGIRFRQHCRAKHLSLRTISERIERAESTVRSWTNGTRDINLVDFFRLCIAAGIDRPGSLFTSGAENRPAQDKEFVALGEAWQYANSEWKATLLTAADAIIKQHRAARSGRASPAAVKRA